MQLSLTDFLTAVAALFAKRQPHSALFLHSPWTVQQAQCVVGRLTAWRVLAFLFQAKSTNDSMSLLTMVMKPVRAKDLNDMMSNLVCWDALIRDCEMKLNKHDISDKMRQAALFAMLPEAEVEHRLAGRRDLDDCAKVRCVIDDMIRDKRQARGPPNWRWRKQSAAARR